jgi:hypothetical protein
MKKITWILLASCIPVLLLFAQGPITEYVVLSWNDLGMHCANKDFSGLVVLPPYNNLTSQVIKKGTASTKPQVVTSGISVTYEVPGNTTSANKTNFWQYAKALFGVDLPLNIGLKGKGLTGNMDALAGYFIAEGIPITPYTDADLINEDPYQLALVKAYDINNNLIGQSTPVIPVSGEINCVSSGCHSSEQSILNKHPREKDFDPNKKPILCAKCHASNALGTTGLKDVKNLSFIIHDKHKDKTSDCYKCHPGPKTKCFRDIMATKGMTCQNCHGSMYNVAKTIENGRRPWLDEPKCGSSNCHGPNYAENTGKLYRQSKGHGGVYCSGCHGSPHAIVPTRDGTRDNANNIALQGYKGVLKECKVCHTVMPTAPGPHNFLLKRVIVENEQSNGFELNSVFPNPVKSESTIPFSISEAGDVHLDIYDSNGKHMLMLVNQYLIPAEYKIKMTPEFLGNGSYVCVLRVNGQTKTTKILVQK